MNTTAKRAHERRERPSRGYGMNTTAERAHERRERPSRGYGMNTTAKRAHEQRERPSRGYGMNTTAERAHERRERPSRGYGMNTTAKRAHERRKRISKATERLRFAERRGSWMASDTRESTAKIWLEMKHHRPRKRLTRVRETSRRRNEGDGMQKKRESRSSRRHSLNRTIRCRSP